MSLRDPSAGVFLRYSIAGGCVQRGRAVSRRQGGRTGSSQASADRSQRIATGAAVAAAARALPLLHDHRRLPAPRSRRAYRLQVTGLVERPLTISRTRSSRRCRRRSIARDFQCVTGLAGARRAVDGRAALDAARSRRREAGGDGAAFRLVRRRVHREPHARAGPPAPTCSSPTSSTASRCRRDHGGPVRLYVARCTATSRASGSSRIELDRRRSCPATGSTAATTSTVWSGKSNGRDDEPTLTCTVTRRRAPAALSTGVERLRALVHRDALSDRRCCDRLQPLRRAAVGISSAGASLVRTIHVYSGLLLPIPVLASRSRCGPARSCADLGRLNRWSRDDRAWWRRASERVGAARQVQPRSEAQRDVHRGPRSSSC